jgi:hypothetical protein
LSAVAEQAFGKFDPAKVVDCTYASFVEACTIRARRLAAVCGSFDLACCALN